MTETHPHNTDQARAGTTPHGERGGTSAAKRTWASTASASSTVNAAAT